MSAPDLTDASLATAVTASAAQWCPQTWPRGPVTLVGAYRIVATARLLAARGSRRVALQFPDALLPESFFVCAALEDTLRLLAGAGEEEDDDGRVVFILGDTSYGECCVDEVAAAHLGADVVVHYGNACLAPTRGLAVVYVFPGEGMGNVGLRERILEVVEECEGVERVVVLYDIELWEAMEDIREEMRTVGGAEVEIARPRVGLRGVVEARGEVGRKADAGCCGGAGECSPGGEKSDVERGADFVDVEETCSCSSCGPLVFACTCGGGEKGRTPDTALHQRTAFLWVSRQRNASDEKAIYACEGSSAIPLRNAALKFSNSAGVLACTPTSSVEPVSMARLLGRRYALVDRVRSAERVGIVAGTLGVSGNLAVIDRLKRLIDASGRRWYTLMVGKPSAAKLANFAEMDAFILVACPQNALVDGRDHLRPVITPFEAEVAFGDRDWFSNAYSADFADVLASKAAFDEGGEKGDVGDETETAVAKRGQWGLVNVGDAGGAAVVLKERRWQGLDASHGADGEDLAMLPTKVTEGRSGVAGGYDEEG